MKGFGKRLGIFAACLFLICALALTASAATVRNCPGNCSHRAAIDTTHYDTLAQAVAEAKDGSTVTLLADTYIDQPITVTSSLTLDLGGKTLTGNMLSNRLAALHFQADGTIRNGKIIVAVGSALRLTDCALDIEKDAVLESIGTAPILSLTAGKEELSQVTVSGQIRSDDTAPAISAEKGEGICQISILEDAEITAAEETAIVFDCAGKLEISGGTVWAKKDAIVITIAEDRKTDLAITDGKVISREGQVITLLPDGKVTLPKGFVTGGTFYPAPSQYISAGSTVNPNFDGSVTVVPSTLLSHTHTGGYATCLRKAVCSVCGQSYGSYGSHSILSVAATEPTCTTVGLSAHSECGYCGSMFLNGVSISAASLSVPALGHDWESVDGTPATCEVAGLKPHRKCKTCDVIQINGVPATEEDLLIASGDHQLEAVAAIPATCSQTGLQAHDQCSICGDLFMGGQPVTQEALSVVSTSHVLSDWQQDGQHHWKTCLDCEAMFRQDLHTDRNTDSLCDECGYSLVEEAVNEAEKSFSLLFLIPMAAAVGIAVPLAVKRRKTA